MAQTNEKSAERAAAPAEGTLLELYLRRSPYLGRGGDRSARSLWTWALSTFLVVAASSCVVLPEVMDVAVQAPVVTIMKDKTDPSILRTVPLERSTPIHVFDVTTAVVPTNVTGELNYFWYYDYADASVPLNYYSLCGDSNKCNLAVCAKPKSSDDDHRLLLVVSDTKLNDDPVDPFDFPEGAAFDSVQWQLKLKDLCPE